jgi:hypothetical protein
MRHCRNYVLAAATLSNLGDSVLSRSGDGHVGHRVLSS